MVSEIIGVLDYAVHSTLTHIAIFDMMYLEVIQMPGPNINSDLIRGHIDTIILRILRDGDNYGYEIIKAVSVNSGHEYELKEPSLYTSLKRLEKQGYISSYWGDESQGGRRKYYHITESGNAAYEKALAEWFYAQKIITMLLQGGDSQ